MAFKADPYADVDFDEVTEATGLAIDEIKCLKVTHRFRDAQILLTYSLILQWSVWLFFLVLMSVTFVYVTEPFPNRYFI